MIPFHLVPRYATRQIPPTCDMHHRRVFMRWAGDVILRADNGAA